MENTQEPEESETKEIQETETREEMLSRHRYPSFN